MTSKNRGRTPPAVPAEGASSRCSRREAIRVLTTAMAAAPLVAIGCVPGRLRSLRGPGGTDGGRDASRPGQDASLGDASLGDASLGDASLGDAGLGDAGIEDAGLDSGPAPLPGGPPAFLGPWFAIDSPWRTPIPSDWRSYVHPDTPSMVQGVYIGTDYSSMDIHAWAYRPTEMQAKWGSHGLNYMKWAGPGGTEAVIYAPSGTPTIRVWVDYPTYKARSVQVPMSFDWNGYKPNDEKRTYLIEEGGDMWALAYFTPPGDNIYAFGNTDTEWHCRVAVRIANGWKIADPTWNAGGSGLPHGPGVITPYDILNTSPGGCFGHAIAVNANSSADGSYSGHPGGVWPAPSARNYDGRTKTAVGIPHGARVFLDPSLTDSDLNALGVTKEWQLQIARTLQRYGAMTKESATGEGSAGGLMCETIESIAWNISKGFYPSGFQWPWIADGTTDNADQDVSTYNDALPAALMPTTGSHWKVFDWNKPYPGISVPA